MNPRIEAILKSLGQSPNQLASEPATSSESAPPTAVQNRVEAVHAAANRVVSCGVCGSTVFFELKLQQYRPGYSAAAGGEIQPANDAPQSVLACPCGNVLMPNIGGVRGGRTPNVMLATLFDSLKQAAAKRGEVARVLQDMVGLVVDPAEFEALKTELAALKAAAGGTAVAAPAGEAKEVEALRARVEALELAVGQARSRTQKSEAERKDAVRELLKEKEKPVKEAGKEAAAAPAKETAKEAVKDTGEDF